MMDWRILTAITVLTWGAYSLFLKKAGSLLPWRVSMFLFVLSYSVLVGLFCFLGQGVSASDVFSRRAVWPVLAGLLCGVGGIAFFMAIPVAPGSVFLPLVSLSMVISGIGCVFFFAEPFSLRLALGVVFAAVAVVLLAR